VAAQGRVRSMSPRGFLPQGFLPQGFLPQGFPLVTLVTLIMPFCGYSSFFSWLARSCPAPSWCSAIIAAITHEAHGLPLELTHPTG
jgi:hypothetical protein